MSPYIRKKINLLEVMNGLAYKTDVNLLNLCFKKHFHWQLWVHRPIYFLAHACLRASHMPLDMHEQMRKTLYTRIKKVVQS